jgi:O-succinylbenzoate synthase
VTRSVVRAEVLEVRMALKEPFVTGFGTTDTRRTVLVHLVDADGNEGWGEAAALDHPFYLPDTTSSTYSVVAEWALPLALAGPPDPRSVAQRLEGIRGNTFARAGVESAFWCLEAAQQGVSLAELFERAARADPDGGEAEDAEDAGGTVGAAHRRRAVDVGDSIGIHPTIESTLEAVDRAVTKGYRRIKLKVKPGWDEEIVAPARDCLGPDAMLQVDANGSYTPVGEDMKRLERLDAYGLACIEQPLAWDDMEGHAKLQARIETPVCLDECLRSARDVRRAFEMDAGRNVNLKPGRVGGVVESLEIHQLCQEAGVPLWCGGMLESGVGRALNIALCALEGFNHPADMSPPLELYDYDLVDPSFDVAPDGTVEVPTAPGLGFEIARDRVARSTLRRAEVPVSPR